MKKQTKPKIDKAILHLAMIIDYYNMGGKSQYKPAYKVFDPEKQYMKISPSNFCVDDNRLN